MLKKLKISVREWVANHERRLSRGADGKRVTMCKNCYTFYYKNSWHLERPTFLEENGEGEISVRFTECLPCLEQELAYFEIEGEPQEEAEPSQVRNLEGSNAVFSST